MGQTAFPSEGRHAEDFFSLKNALINARDINSK
jgi:hypothetical protein